MIPLSQLLPDPPSNSIPFPRLSLSNRQTNVKNPNNLKNRYIHTYIHKNNKVKTQKMFMYTYTHTYTH